MNSSAKNAKAAKKEASTLLPLLRVPSRPSRMILPCLGLCLLLTGCTTYTERFSKFNADGTLAHTVTVKHRSFFASAEASKLRTETQTEDFIRNVNADSIATKPDSAAIKAAAEGMAKGVVDGLKAANGLP